MYVQAAVNKLFSLLNKQLLLQSLRGLYGLYEGCSKRNLSVFQFHCKVNSGYEQTLSMTLDFPLFMCSSCISYLEYAQEFFQSHVIIAHQNF